MSANNQNGVPAWAVPAGQGQGQGQGPAQGQQQQAVHGQYPPPQGQQQQQFMHQSPSSSGVAPPGAVVQPVPLVQYQQAPHSGNRQQHPSTTVTPPVSGGVAVPHPAVQQQQLQQQPRAPPPAATTAPTASASSSSSKSRLDRMEDKVLVTRTADEETEDGRIKNREAMAKIRDAWVYKQVRSRVGEFTDYKQAMVFVGSWNVNAKGKEESLEDFICKDWGPDGRYAPDVVCVGFQEIVDLNAVNVAVDNKTQQRSQYWADQLRLTLNAPHRLAGNAQERGYALVMQRSMVGLLICLFVKNPHRHRCKAVNSDSVGVGVMGMMGNKGGVSVRLQFYDSTICFVCSHLAAHRENVAGRNADYFNVLQKVAFDIGEDSVRENIRNGSMSQWASGSATVGVPDHDVVFWLGDLNYRIDESMPTEKVLDLSVKGAIDQLRSLDQLNIERREGRVFQGFQEGVLNFVPTYKYQPGTDVYEQRPEKKLRAPAWCDRILWLSQDPRHVEQITYNRSETPNISDHKPVYSTLRLTIKDVVVERREAVYRELLGLLDRFENQSLPTVGLDKVELDFGEVRYGQSIILPIQITNTGNVCAQWRFVPKLDENSLCKNWMTVTPTYGMLIPGEPPATINVTVKVENTTAQLLNSGREVLDDILILRLENGRDYYITCKGDYARSCFGMSLEDLVLYKAPVRTIPLDPIERSKHFSNENEISPSNALCIPKELWRVVDAIFEKGLQTPDLFSVPGVKSEVDQIREALDTGAPFATQSSIHSFVECFTGFLASLSTPVIPSTLFPTVEINSENIQSMARKFLEDLPPVHYNVLVYVLSFFREVLLYRDSNLMTAAKLARICCKYCSPTSPNVVMESSMVQRRAGMHLLLLHLLETSSI
eukprot:CAMPEP_0113514608 /NCGR_PEP_ID=MMETSP0014_2-20120614/40501_1 /TAXON_ID=2857 /ORGANISM="Nitzschia sp." /LENGTH=883 /DNA_ID=CAMNT_0000411119 /DNA_START=70 /DNA_END=2721 /DNA_ORIENTATION=+ /assembly_acc=CAM_ASM_000159